MSQDSCVLALVNLDIFSGLLALNLKPQMGHKSVLSALQMTKQFHLCTLALVGTIFRCALTHI